MQHICDQTNLYATQNEREFSTNPEEMCVLLGINYTMSISKLPNVECYWSADSYLSDDYVRNAMARNRFMNILQNSHFTDIQTADKSDNAFQDAMSEAGRQSIDEHMTKFIDRLSCKQYIKTSQKMGFQVVVLMLQQNRIPVRV